MNTVLGQLKEVVNSISPKARKRILWTLAVLFILQLYFVRELIAAEILFGLMFVALSVLAGICYFVGTIGERGLDWAEVVVRVVASTARRSYSALDAISKKSFRHPHSESAQ